MAPERSATRCRPGDLAILVACEPGESGADLGKLVRVVRHGYDWGRFGDSRLHWSCDTLGSRFECSAGPFFGLSNGRELVDIPDVLLRPIRGDGLAERVDDAAPVHAGGVTA